MGIVGGGLLSDWLTDVDAAGMIGARRERLTDLTERTVDFSDGLNG